MVSRTRQRTPTGVIISRPIADPRDVLVYDIGEDRCGEESNPWL